MSQNVTFSPVAKLPRFASLHLDRFAPWVKLDSGLAEGNIAREPQGVENRREG